MDLNFRQAFSLLLLTAVGQLQAALIPISNASFEIVTNNANTAPCLTGGSLKNGFFIDAQTQFGLSNGCIDQSPLPGWSITGGSAGVQSPGPSNFPGGIPNGANVGYSNGGLLSQSVGDFLRIGTYTLEVGIGNRLDMPFLNDYTISLLAGANTVGSHTNAVNPARGVFQTDTLVINIAAGDPRLGQPLQIQLLGNSPQVNFDDVRLDGPAPGTTIPEPASSGLIGSGICALFMWARRRKSTS